MSEAMRRVIAKRLTQIAGEHERALREVAGKVREQLVIPTCDAKGLKFRSGNGLFFFTPRDNIARMREGRDEFIDSTDDTLVRKYGLKRVFAVLELPTSENLELGHYIEDYTPGESK